MTFLTLTTEIGTWLQQNLSGTNPVWTKAIIQASINEAIRDFSSLNLKDKLAEDATYSASEVTLPTDFITAFRLTKNSETVPLMDIQKLDLTGIADPFTDTDAVQYAVDLHNSNDVRVLRLFPQASNTAHTVDLWYKAQITEPSADANTVEINDWLIPLIKFRAL